MSDPRPAPLGQAELDRIFDEEIVARRLELDAHEPHPRPAVVLLGGQPGAGLYVATHELLPAFRNEYRTPAIVGLNELRVYDPGYRAALAIDDVRASETVAQSARYWELRTHTWLRDHHQDAVLRVSFRDPDATMGVASDFAAAGYRVHVAALAVHPAWSQLGIIESYSSGRRMDGYGTWDSRSSHDADYHATPEVLRRAEASPDVDRVTVMARRGFDFHTVIDVERDQLHGLAPGQIPSADALVSARRTLSDPDRAVIAERLDFTTRSLRERDGALHPEVQGMANRVSGLLADPRRPVPSGPLDMARREIAQAREQLRRPAPQRSGGPSLGAPGPVAPRRSGPDPSIER